MVKKTGSFLYYIVFAISFISHTVFCSINTAQPSIDLFIVDMQGNTINQVALTQPFMLKVVVKNVASDQMPVGLDLWKSFTYRFVGSEQAMTSINGNISRSTTYNYVLNATKKGQFQYQPLTVTDRNGSVITSNKVTIIVDDAIAQSQSKSHTDQPFILMANIKDKKIYVGQKVVLHMQFGYRDDFEDLRIVPAQLEGIHVGSMTQKPSACTISTSAGQYDGYDFSMEIYPMRPGTITIPPFQATFLTNKYNFAMNSFASLLINGGRELIQSRSYTFEVMPLPESDQYKNVTAIGDFSSIDLTANVNQGSVGQGIVLTMKVEGSGNFEMIKFPDLTLPEGLHFYEGNMKTIDISNKKSIKEFEWILQADRPGQFNILPQKFVYFDPIAQRYLQLESKSISITMTGQAIAQSKFENSSSTLAVEQKSDNALKSIKEKQLIDYANSYMQYFFNPHTFLSKILYWIIYFLLGIVALMLIYTAVKPSLAKLFFVQIAWYRMQWHYVLWTKNQKQIYFIFEMMLDQYDLTIQGDEMKSLLISLNLSQQEQSAYQNFIETLWQMNYSENYTQSNTTDFWLSAQQIFEIILRCCRLKYESMFSSYADSK